MWIIFAIFLQSVLKHNEEQINETSHTLLVTLVSVVYLLILFIIAVSAHFILFLDAWGQYRGLHRPKTMTRTQPNTYVVPWIIVITEAPLCKSAYILSKTNY